MARPKVLLPQPLSPTRPRVSPRRSSRSTPSTARTDPARRPAHQLDEAVGHAEMDREVLDLQQRAHAGSLERLPAQTGGPMAGRGLDQRRCGPPGRRARHRRSAGWKLQPRGRSIRDGGCPAIEGSSSRGRRRARLGADQPGGVGVQRPAQQRALGRPLDDPAGIHHRDRVADLGDHAEVVADQDDREPAAVAQLEQQPQDLRLHGDVEGRGRLVGDQQLGAAGERGRDHRALAHAAGELVRIGADAPAGIGNADLRGADRSPARAPLARDRP